MTRLERRYRLLLRLLPPWYRRQRAEEMAATFLAGRADELDLEYGWPGWMEFWSIVALAARTRLAADAAPPRALAMGDAVRLVALLGLLAQAALGLGQLGSELLRLRYSGLLGRASVVELGVPLVAIVPFVLLVLGHRTWAKVTAVAAVVPGVITLAGKVIMLIRATPTSPLGVPWAVVMIDLPLWVAVGCLCAGFHRQAPPPPAARWLRALAGAAVLIVLWLAVVDLLPFVPWAWVLISDPGALLRWTVVAGGLTYLALVVFRRFDRSGAWAGALAVCAAALLPVQIQAVWVASLLHGADRLGVLPWGLVLTQSALLAVVVVATATRAVHALHRASALVIQPMR
jgi:hypothetical protein